MNIGAAICLWQAEQHLRRLISLCGNIATRAQIMTGGVAKILVQLVRSGPGRAVERSAELIARLCCGDQAARAAFGAAGAVEALLGAIETHRQSPLVTEAVSDALAGLCEGFAPNCRELEAGGGIPRLHSVASEGGGWTGTPRARRRCSVALREASISAIHLDIPATARPARDTLASEKSKTARLRFRSAIRTVAFGVSLIRRTKIEERRWALEERFFDGLRRCEELGRLFQETSNPGELNAFFSRLLDRLEASKLPAEGKLSNDLVCCFVTEGTVRIDLAGQREEVVEGPAFCASHFLRQRLKDISILAATVSNTLPFISRNAISSKVVVDVQC